ncbi:MAG: carboxypeptidase-like regulatory domain-containing protein [Chitinophagaceae bacterium]
MANDNTIRTFTAIDIEKYHQGLLSAREMHDMEKAALDDPFLADALEGYAVPEVNAAADLADLKKRLSDRIEEEDNKVVPLATSTFSSRWWKVAAMILLVAGAGAIIYKMGFVGNKDSSIAKIEPKPASVSEPDKATSATDSFADYYDSTSRSASNMHTGKLDDPRLLKLPPGMVIDTGSVTASSNAASPVPDGDGVADRLSEVVPVTSEKTKDEAIADYKSRRNNNVPKELELKKPAYQDYRRDSSVAIMERFGTYNQKNGYDNTISDSFRYNVRKKNPLKNNKALNSESQVNFGNAAANNLPLKRNVFRGTVTDNNNNAVPFANITNVADNVGTYTDAKGYFVLTSTDSLLNVQVKSIGYENSLTQLQSKPNANQVVMQDDNKSLSEIVISHKKITSTRSQTSNMVLEEPEPVDGWDNYDTYVANNLVVPETFKTKQSLGSEVELSFDVNKNGEPVNITVDKSLCESCDKEAIRIIRDGPKWKRKAKKKGRTSVTISF